jgi:carboxylesterase
MSANEKFKSYLEDVRFEGGRIGVLLIHSLGGSPAELRFVAQALARSGYTVHCPMLPGLAGGTDVSGLSQWSDWYAALETAHDRLLEVCDVVLVGGLSAGSILGLRLAAKRPDNVHGLMLFAPTLKPNGWAIPWYFNLFYLVRERFTARMFHFQQRPPYGIKDERIRKFVMDSFQSGERPIEDLFGRGGIMVYEFLRLVKEVKRLLGSIHQHTLIFHPRHDDQSDLSNAVTLQRNLAGTVETCVLEDSYHMVTLDRQRVFVVDRTVDFVQRLTQRIADEAAVSRMRRRVHAVAAAE